MIRNGGSMPCSSPVPDYDPVVVSIEALKREVSSLRSEDRQKDKEESSDVKKELDLVTALLCGVLSSNPKLVKKSSDLKRWWAEHQYWDKKREKMRK